jgi:outer membrane scaffolding protein for murein synthesis (MipA/OmpV family)
VKAWLAFLGLILSTLVQAQETLLGAGLRSRPAYDGSAEQRTDIVPVIRYYGRPGFARTTQGILEAGVRTELDKDFWAGAQLAYEPGRARQPELDAGVSAGLHLEWDRRVGPVPVTFLIRARQHLDTARGGQADLRATAGVFQGGGFSAGVFGQATWGTENAVRSMYGPPDSGLLFTSLGALASYEIHPRWLLVAGLERRSLNDEAANSPISEKKTGTYATAGIAYRFAPKSAR